MKKVFGTILACAIVTTSASAVLADAPLLTAATSAPNYTVVINGDKIDADGIYTEGKQIMLPLRSVAEKLGYKVTWDEAKQGITLDNGEVNTTVYIGEDNYYMASSTAIGMSAPTALGAAPVLKGDKTYVPAEMFSVLNCGKVYTVADGVITFGDANKADSKDESVQIPNPFTEYESIELASGGAVLAPGIEENADIDSIRKEVGYDFALPDYMPQGYTFDSASLLFGELVQIVYTDGEHKIMYRIEDCTDDISGDYNNYETVETVDMGGAAVTVREDGGKCRLAIWNDGKAHVLWLDEGFERYEIEKIIKSIG